MVTAIDVLNQVARLGGLPYIWGNPQRVRMLVPAKWRSQTPSWVTMLDVVSSENIQGADCSGMIYWALYHAGYTNIQRMTATTLWKACTPVSMEFAVKTPGTLVFFKKNSIYHVEMMAGDGMVWGAQVRTGIKKRKWADVSKWESSAEQFAGWLPAIEKPSGIFGASPAGKVLKIAAGLAVATGVGVTAYRYL